MGASGWRYTTAYDPDPEVALHRLREDTFASGDYLPLGGIMRFPRDAQLPPGTLLRTRLLMAALRAVAAVSVAVHWFARGGRMPRSIDELLAMSRENGTHSILDIGRTADFPESGAATPMTRRRLLQNFGTTTPTRAQVDLAFDRSGATPGEHVRRWEAVYFVVYDEEGTPIEYEFVGASGD